MELLRTNISSDGRLEGARKERLSLVEEDTTLTESSRNLDGKLSFNNEGGKKTN